MAPAEGYMRVLYNPDISPSGNHLTTPQAKWIPIGRSKFLEGSDMGVRPQAGMMREFSP